MDNGLLLVDDDRELCDMLQSYLAQEGFTADAVYDGESAIDKVLSNIYNLVILDIMLPGHSGFEVLKTIRETSSIPVLMLTARGEDVDSVVGLELGADDYLAKPCNPRVLVAHIRAILRRSQSNNLSDNPDNQLTIGNIELFPHSRTVYREQDPVALTSTEFTILETLMRGQRIPMRGLFTHPRGLDWTRTEVGARRASNAQRRMPRAQATAMTSISTWAPLGSPAAWMVTRAGWVPASKRAP